MPNFMPNQDCPLCNGVAAFSVHDYGRRKGINCPSCTEFIISLKAETKLINAPQSWKKQLSEKAKATPSGQILVITVPSMHQPDAQATESLRGEYEPIKN